jgi:hypothetical protein
MEPAPASPNRSLFEPSDRIVRDPIERVGLSLEAGDVFPAVRSGSRRPRLVK